MASIDVPVALLGYGTVGAAVNRLLVESADDIERATGHRLRVVKALVRDVEKHRGFPAAEGVLTTDFASVAEDDSIAVVAEVMVVEWNDITAVQEVFAAPAGELAGVVCEPYAQGFGCVAPAPGFLETIRELCTRYGVPLVFDEVEFPHEGRAGSGER